MFGFFVGCAGFLGGLEDVGGAGPFGGGSGGGGDLQVAGFASAEPLHGGADQEGGHEEDDELDFGAGHGGACALGVSTNEGKCHEKEIGGIPALRGGVIVKGRTGGRNAAPTCAGWEFEAAGR